MLVEYTFSHPEQPKPSKHLYISVLSTLTKWSKEVQIKKMRHIFLCQESVINTINGGMNKMSNKIYKVVDDDGYATSIVGYASGNPDDIKRYFGRFCTYEAKVEAIPVVDVTPQLVAQRYLQQETLDNKVSNKVRK